MCMCMGNVGVCVWAFRKYRDVVLSSVLLFDQYGPAEEATSKPEYKDTFQCSLWNVHEHTHTLTQAHTHTAKT